MALIKIVKGDTELTIPAGAYKMYASIGWEMAGKPDAHTNTEATLQDADLPTNPQREDDSVEEAETEPEEIEEEYEEVEVDPEELLKKPVGDLDYEELQIVAEYLGLNTKELTTVKALRKAIKEAQN